MREHDFQQLSEDILLMLYDRTSNYGHADWDLLSAFSAINKDALKDQADAVLERMVAKGWVVAEKSMRLQQSFPVRLTELGKTSAISILERRAPKSLSERLRGVSRSDWIALAALLVSLVALLSSFSSMPKAAVPSVQPAKAAQ